MQSETMVQEERWTPPEPGLASRIVGLREMYWDRTYHQTLVRKEISGCGQDTLTGHATDLWIMFEAFVYT